MSDLKLWRRKLGVVTLLMACLCTAAWVRGLHTADLVQFRKPPRKTSGVVFASGNIGCFWWDRECWKYFQQSPESLASTNHWQSVPIERLYLYRSQDPFQRYRVLPYRVTIDRDLGPDQSRLESEGIWGPNIIATGNVVYIPYSNIVLPLTLLSAWLLFSKPRPEVKMTV